ncbi:MAG TPA: adenylate/guanylate cyclase domain-containing protein [Ignavibacteriaceae bacterium]|nr:adenylate/guanylate cyclase domain-containing protein [Ignavibacteriaceae bacterium]
MVELRKLAAIMFTDMVGYSALTQKNEKLALELLDEHRRLVRPVFVKYNGREIETAGDSFFVEFNSALEAVHCAVEMQNMLNERNNSVGPDRIIKLRIGLHLGDVVYMDKHVHGDGVNIAARIEPLAKPGGISISEDIARQIQNKIELPVAKIGKSELKNIRLPMDLYRIIMPWEKKHLLSERLKFIISRRRNKVLGFVTLLIFSAIVFYYLISLISPSSDRNSIAVLPFINLNQDRENEFFSDGITEDIITQLSKISKLKIISRTSVMQYKKSLKDLREVGEELNVSNILEGSVRRAGNNIRIVAQLIDAKNNDQLWSDSYDKQITEIFSIQSDVALKIAQSLKAKLSPAEKDRLEMKPTDNLEAYELYLKGRYYWNQRMPDQLKIGIDYFNQALERDSNYALVYAGLADSYIIQGDYNILPPKTTYPQAIWAATKALEINSQLAEAHTSFAVALMHYKWDWVNAETEFKRAIELNPNCSLAYAWYALFLTVRGRFNEAFLIRKKAFDLDPLSASISSDAGLTLYFSRKYDESIRQFQKTLEEDPNFVLAYIPLGAAYTQKKMYKEAIRAYKKVSSAYTLLTGETHPIPIAAIAYVYAVSGRKNESIDLLAVLLDIAKNEYVSPYWIAVIYTGLGKKDEALAWLEKGYTEHDGLLIFLNVDPIFDSLRKDSKFISLLKKLGFKADI